MRGEVVTVPPRAVDLVARKRDGGELSGDELAWFVGGYLEGKVSEGQAAALLMAGVLRGFSDDEARALTDVLLDSGDRLDLSALPGPTVDKHSTGGVADGTTLLVAPLIAAAGGQMVKLSGRGLGHTGGTLDKLESIPGLRTGLDADDLLAIAEGVGCVVAAQSDRLVPADRALYALRDVTGTVASPALIASSVMSKKLAGGASSIVLDVKAGEGAFLATTEAAARLAELCVGIATAAGRRCATLVTGMDQPLGRGVGNALEVAEAVELLSAPPRGRMAELAVELAATGLALARSAEMGDVRVELRERWKSGAALARLEAMVAAQGGDPGVCERPREVLPAAPVVRDVPAERPGSVAAVPAREVGELAAMLGAGRARKEDSVDPAVGIELAVEVGDRIERGDRLAVVHARTEDDAVAAVARLQALVRLREEPVRPPRTVLDRFGG